jgi:hypothetical protein
MNKRFVSFSVGCAMLCISTCLLLPVSFAPLSAAHASTASALSRPLMVIRFNQPRVFFQQPLYTALSRAIEAEPAVRFHLVSYIPQTTDARRNQQAQQRAQANLGAVLQQMRQMGVPESQISATTTPDGSLAFDEVHLFVR